MHVHDSRNVSSGFTLVEIAMVIVAVGILVGGVVAAASIKRNAEVLDYIKSFKQYEASAIKFKELYGELPGDIRNPQSVLTDCSTLPCTRGGNGNSFVSDDLSEYATTDTTQERFVFWNHLYKAGLITGIRGENNVNFDAGQPSAQRGGGFRIFGHTSDTAGAWQKTAGMNHFLGVTAIGGDDYHPWGDNKMPCFLTQRIDSKVDDGIPLWGFVQTGAMCPNGSGDTSTYRTDLAGVTSGTIYWYAKF